MKRNHFEPKDLEALQQIWLKKVNAVKTANQKEIVIKIPLDLKDHPKAILKYSIKAYSKVRNLVKCCDKEIAWHGVVSKSTSEAGTTTYYIEDIVMFPQTITSATVVGKEPDYAIWNANLPNEVLNKLRYHGHSHVNMGVVPSGIDTSYQESMLETLEDFYVFTINNKRDEIWACIVDIEDNITYEKEDIDVVIEELDDLIWATAAMKEYVTEQLPLNIPTTVTYNKPATTLKSPTCTDYLGYGSYNKNYQQLVMQQIANNKQLEALEKDLDSDYAYYTGKINM